MFICKGNDGKDKRGDDFAYEALLGNRPPPLDYRK